MDTWLQALGPGPQHLCRNTGYRGFFSDESGSDGSCLAAGGCNAWFRDVRRMSCASVSPSTALAQIRHCAKENHRKVQCTGLEHELPYTPYYELLL